MPSNVFSRYEKKFLLNEEDYRMLREALKSRMQIDRYSADHGYYTICNVYYDTEDDYLIKKSISKPVFKEKIRVRSYGVPDPADSCFLELKKKYKGRVHKRRIRLPLETVMAFLDGGPAPESDCFFDRQVLAEFGFFMRRYSVVPKVYIAYDRIALHAEEVRLTVDTNIRTRRDNLRLDYGDSGDPLLPEGLYLVEIKVDQVYPLWLSSILSEHRWFSDSFSKYGREFVRNLHEIRSKQEDRQCSNPLSSQVPSRLSA